jgi:hypothetical protein
MSVTERYIMLLMEQEDTPEDENIEKQEQPEQPENPQDQEEQPEQEEEGPPEEQEPEQEQEGPPPDQGEFDQEQPGAMTIPAGRIYELKKIYNRLYTLRDLLDNYSDMRLEPLKKEVREALDIFKIYTSDPTRSEGDLDEFITDYYKFIKFIFANFDEFVDVYNKENKKKSSK